MRLMLSSRGAPRNHAHAPVSPTRGAGASAPPLRDDLVRAAPRGSAGHDLRSVDRVEVRPVALPGHPLPTGRSPRRPLQRDRKPGARAPLPPAAGARPSEVECPVADKSPVVTYRRHLLCSTRLVRALSVRRAPGIPAHEAAANLRARRALPAFAIPTREARVGRPSGHRSLPAVARRAPRGRCSPRQYSPVLSEGCVRPRPLPLVVGPSRMSAGHVNSAGRSAPRALPAIERAGGSSRSERGLCQPLSAIAAGGARRRETRPVVRTVAQPEQV